MGEIISDVVNLHRKHISRKLLDKVSTEKSSKPETVLSFRFPKKSWRVYSYKWGQKFRLTWIGNIVAL